MSKQNTWIVKAKIYNENYNNFEEYYTMLHAEDLSHAAKIIEEYIGGPNQGVLEVIITYMDDYPIDISREEYERLYTERYNLEQGDE